MVRVGVRVLVMVRVRVNVTLGLVIRPLVVIIEVSLFYYKSNVYENFNAVYMHDEVTLTRARAQVAYKITNVLSRAQIVIYNVYQVNDPKVSCIAYNYSLYKIYHIIANA